jgi:hypothetical protein
MANTTIGALTAASSANDVDLLIIEQGGVTYKITKQNLFLVITNSLNAEIAATNSDVTSIQSNYIKKDGTVTATASLNMGTNKIIGVVDPASAQDAATKNYVDARKLSDLAVPTSDLNISSQKIINLAAPTSINDATPKTYVDSAVNNCLRWDASFDIDCSGNPNIPALSYGEILKVSVAGLLGGASGETVEAGDLIICRTTTAGGTWAAEGSKLIVLQTNIVGDASATAKGVVEIATDAEVITGTDTSRAVTAASIENKLSERYWQRTTVSAATYTTTEDDYGIIGVTRTASGAAAITLPAISGLTTAGKEAIKARYIIVDEGGLAQSNNITIDTTGADTINGGTSLIIDSNHGSIELYNNGSSGWFTTSYLDVKTVAPANTIYTVTRLLTSVEILALNTSHINIVADTAGHFVVPISLVGITTFGTAAYATNTTLSLTAGSSALLLSEWDQSLLTATTTVVKQGKAVISSGNTVSDLTPSKGLYLQVKTGNPTAGDGTIEITVQYMLVPTP